MTTFDTTAIHKGISGIPTLSSSCMKVSLSIGVPPLSKKDKQASEEVTHAKNANRGRAIVRKSLIDSSWHRQIKTIEGEARAYHRKKTMAWGDLGERLLVNQILAEYQHGMGEFDKQFWDSVDKFLAAYPADVARQQMELGDLFNESDYPSVEELRSKFRFRVTFDRLADVGDFRSDIQNTAMQEVAKQYEESMQAFINESMADFVERLTVPLANMSDKLDYDEEGKPRNGHFKGTLVTNVLEIVDVMKAFNIVHNPQLEQVRQELRAALSGVTAEQLKQNDGLRRKTKHEIDKVRETIASLGNGGWV